MLFRVSKCCAGRGEELVSSVDVWMCRQNQLDAETAACWRAAEDEVVHEQVCQVTDGMEKGMNLISTENMNAGPVAGSLSSQYQESSSILVSTNKFCPDCTLPSLGIRSARKSLQISGTDNKKIPFKSSD